MHKQLGTILVEQGACSPPQIDAGLARQRELAERSHYKHLGTLLMEMGLISIGQLQRALESQKGMEARG